MSFVDEINTSHENLQIAKPTSSSWSGNMSLKVVDEGVGDHKQLEAICGLGCNFIREYYYSEPLSVRDTEGWMQRMGTVCA